VNLLPTTRRFATAVALAIWAGATVAHAAELTVRPVAPAEARARASRHAVPVRGGVMTPGERNIVTLRSARQRSFLPLQRVLMAPGSGIDRSRFASRREGWRAPAGLVRDDAAPGGLRAQPLSAAFVTPPDTIHVALLRIDFLHDRGGAASTGDGHFDLSGPDTNAVPIDRAPHNRDFYTSHGTALERYYDVQSYGRIVVKVDVWPAEQDSAYHLSDMADLGPWAFGNSVYDAAVKMFREMFFAADSQSTRRGDRIPWQKYDRFLVIHAGGDLQSDLKQDSKEDIPSFTVFLGDTNRVVFPDSAAWNLDRPIDRASFVPETINQDGYYGALNGVIAHEMGHNMFGFLDVYDIESGFPVCGYWSLMDSGNLVGSRVFLKDQSEIYAVGMLPPSIDPFQRNFIADGMDIRVPTWGDTLALADNERHSLFYKVPLSSDEYLLLENRFQSPADTLLQLDADSTTKVVLGPKQPDRFEYDALLPGTGTLVWHVDESVVPFDRSLRINPDYGLNSNWSRQGMQVIEADGLDDLGDAGSPFLLGSPLDPYQYSVNPSLSDSTMPNLVPNQGTRPHVRLDFLDDASPVMHLRATRTWSLPAYPVRASFPAGGPLPLVIDADGDRNLDVCWAGGDPATRDSSALFAVRPNGQGIWSGQLEFAFLDRKPNPLMAATVTGDPVLGTGPSLFAVTTLPVSAADTLGGRVWLLDDAGAPMAGWPVRLPAQATTPPLLAGAWPNIVVFVGAADGVVYALNPAGVVIAHSATLPGPISGRLALWQGGPAVPVSIGAGGIPTLTNLVAAGTSQGAAAVFSFDGCCGFTTAPGWPKTLGASGFTPDFLWIRFGGEGANADGNCADGPSLVIHHADRLWAYCPRGEALAGWGRSFGDTLVAGLGAGDPDGDGFPEVLVQSIHSRVAFVNRDGYPSPGWPRAGTSEANLLTTAPPLALDVDGDGRSEIVTLNGSGMLVALRADGRTPVGWPLATGAGAAGGAVAGFFTHDGALDLAAPDRDTLLYAYSLPVGPGFTETPLSGLAPAVATAWMMTGGDAGRTSALPAGRTPQPAAATAGPLVNGSLKAFPNPARRSPVSFAYTLTEDAQVEFRILDTSGHEVAAFTRRGQRSDNREIWDPGALPAGLYMAHLKFTGAGGSHVSILPVGVLR
jgi:M6 family metalloprotease-like protein